jgi:hypothetical protein
MKGNCDSYTELKPNFRIQPVVLSDSRKKPLLDSECRQKSSHIDNLKKKIYLTRKITTDQGKIAAQYIKGRLFTFKENLQKPEQVLTS